jgi:hypothetical protein
MLVGGFLLLMKFWTVSHVKIRVEWIVFLESAQGDFIAFAHHESIKLCFWSLEANCVGEYKD